MTRRFIWLFLMLVWLIGGVWNASFATEADYQVVPIDMSMENYIPWSDNWQTATEWATETAQQQMEGWLQQHPDGHVVVLAHSGGSFVVDKLNQQVPGLIDKEVIYSNGVYPDHFIANLEAGGLDSSQVLIIASRGDIQVPFAWYANGYDDRVETGMQYSLLQIENTGIGHSEMVTQGGDSLSLTGTLPGLSPTEALQGMPNQYILDFINLADLQPTLYLTIPGTEVASDEFGVFPPGTGAGALCDLAAQAATQHAGASIAADPATTQPSGWSPGWTAPNTGGVESGSGGGIESFPVYGDTGNPHLTALTSFHAEDFFPEIGLPGATTQDGVANDAEIIGGSRARARDYLIDGVIHATVLGIETIDAPYVHSKVICDRFHGGDLETVEVVNFWNTAIVPGYWYLERIKTAGYLEYSTTFTVRYRDDRITIDCLYLPDYYPIPYPGEIVTYQIWGATPEEVGMLLRGVLAKAAEFAAVDIDNLTDRIVPSLFAQSARLAGGQLKIQFVNLGPELNAHLEGTTWRWDPADTLPVSLPLTLPTGISQFTLDLGTVRGAMLHTVVNNFLDSVFVSVPVWFAFNDAANGGASSINLEIGPSDYLAPHRAEEYYVFGNMHMSGRLDAVTIQWPYAGVGTQLEPRDVIADLSSYGYLQFWAAGDESEYRLQLESPVVLDNDYHGTTFHVETEWRPYTISLSGLTQQGFGVPVAFDASQIRSLIFLKLHTPGAFDVRVSEIRFAPVGPWPLLFNDVPIDFWSATHIYALVEGGIVAGYQEDTAETPESEAAYAPALSVKRDQMAVFLARALCGGDDYVPYGPPTPSFADVPTNQWAYKYIEYCKSQHVVQGYWNGYRPGEEVTRDQMAVFVGRAYAPLSERPDLPGYTPPAIPSFPDVPLDHWAFTFIEYCSANGIVQGYWDGYHPERVARRDQMAVYVARAFLGIP